MSLPIKVGMVSLGCPKNQVDAEIMLHKIKEAGFTLETDAGLSDIVIINTCGFIESAKQEAIEQILEFLTLKGEGRIKKVIVTGCLAERYAEDIRILRDTYIANFGSFGKAAYRAVMDAIKEQAANRKD